MDIREKTSVRYANGPLLKMSEEMDNNDVLMRFPGGEKSVLSGLFNGSDEIKGRAGVAVVPAGKGEVVMFTTNPTHVPRSRAASQRNSCDLEMAKHGRVPHGV